ncbi:hypothetical protein HWV62_38050 [Athelia sp. TMB]|nr:hypothetical protein HWV62_38050 [Athelia sp. TMB]
MSTTPKPGPFWHVIRFLDHPMLPANAGRDYPKIVKHGIDDDGPMHPKSPHASGPDGAATLLYKMGRENWLQRLLDVKGTETFSLEVGSPDSCFQQLYVKRVGSNVELGFYSSDGLRTPAHGVRYVIDESGQWEPISTSDLGRGWGGSDVWVRAQGEAFAQHIWYMDRWSDGEPVTLIEWAGMTEEEKSEARAWSKEREQRSEEAKKLAQEKRDNEQDEDPQERERKYREHQEMKIKECRAGCGVKDASYRCSKCKELKNTVAENVKQMTGSLVRAVPQISLRKNS